MRPVSAYQLDAGVDRCAAGDRDSGNGSIHQAILQGGQSVIYRLDFHIVRVAENKCN